jgi:hypothetical protein
MSSVCAACHHTIDDAAKICPYCGSDPRTGEKIVDTQALLQEVFHPRQMSATEGVLQYARQRQGIVITFAVILVMVALSGFHQFVLRRNRTVVSEAVPLTDVADLSSQPDETRALPMPELKFQFDGNPKTMRSFIIEPGAVAPAAPPAVPPPAAAAQPKQ